MRSQRYLTAVPFTLASVLDRFTGIWGGEIAGLG